MRTRHTKLTLTFAFLIQSLIVVAQNLVPNGGFERGKCPQGYSTKVQDFAVDDWFVPDTGTPDYFHSCSLGDSVVPYNWAGVARPYEGAGYIGIYLKKGSLYTEHLVVKLTEPLLKDSTYEGVIHIHPSIYASYFPKVISIAISRGAIPLSNLTNHDFRMIELSVDWDMDDLGWIELLFTYRAKGGEQFLTIGKLTSEVLQMMDNPHFRGSEPMLKGACYVYLDHVSLRSTFDEVEPIRALDESNSFEITYPLFGIGKHELQQAYTNALDSLTKQIMEDSSVYEIIGKTDNVGSESYNYELGQKRAESVVNYLISRGVKPNRLMVSSTGEQSPMMSNVDEVSRSQNRTVVIRIKK